MILIDYTILQVTWISS